MAKVKKAEESFKKIFDELESINDWFSGQDIDLDEALEKFKRGMELVKKSREKLKKVENDFEEIKKDLQK